MNARMPMRRGTAMVGLCAAMSFMVPHPAPASDSPRRVVSFNLCADQLVVALADPQQIAGLSPYAADPLLSVVADQAKAFPRLPWVAESTLAAAPDLVLVGPDDRSATRGMLERQGVRVADIALVSSIAQARRQILDVAALLGHPDRGEVLAAQLDAARARLDHVGRLPFATASVLERGGYTSGPVSLAAALVEEAGLKSPAGTPRGLGGFLPLEKLLVLQPDMVFLIDPPARATDQGALYLTHPALRARYPQDRRVALPARYTLCGGPALVAGLDYLAAALSKLSAAPPTTPQ